MAPSLSDPRAQGARRPAASGQHHPPAAAGIPPDPAARLRRRSAPQPGQIRHCHGGITHWSRVHHQFLHTCGEDSHNCPSQPRIINHSLFRDGTNPTHWYIDWKSTKISSTRFWKDPVWIRCHALAAAPWDVGAAAVCTPPGTTTDSHLVTAKSCCATVCLSKRV